MGKLIKPLTPKEIYDALTGGPGTSPLEDAQSVVRREAVTQGVRAALIAKQADLLQSGWEGSASDAASNAAKPLIANAHSASDQLLEAQALMDQQSGSFHHAANSVRPVSAEPPKMDFADMLWPFVDYERQVTDWQADAQHNIEVFRGYDTASEGNQNGMRTYSTVDDSGGTVSVTDTGDVIEIPDGGQPGDGEQPAPFDGRRDPGSGPGSVPVGGSPVSGPLPGGQQPQQTSPSDFVPRPAAPIGPLPGGQPVPTGPGAGGFVPEPSVGGFIPGGVYGGTRGPGIGSGTGEPGPGGRGPGAGTRGGVLGAGPGAGALAAEEAATRRAAAAAAARSAGAGAMGGAPVGAGRGKGEEDDEHRRKVLIEADTEGLFGSDVLTAPQVIGDDEYEDD